MTKTAVTLGSLAALVLIGGVVLWTLVGDTAAATASSGASVPPARVAARQAPPRATLDQRRPVEAERDEDPPELPITPIKRAFIVRDDDAVPPASDAPAPVLAKSTLAAMRAAVMPAVERCMAASFETHPENRSLDTKPSVSVIFTAVASAGVVSITKTASVINGTQEDELRHCIETAYKQLSVPAAPGQRDGEERVQSTFDYK